MSSVGTEIVVELERNQELLKIYNDLPNNAGAFGAMLITNDIAEAQRALASGDVLWIIKAYEKLKGNE